MLQGDSDKGQPNYLFDGSAKMEIVPAPIASIRDRIMRMNSTHKILVTHRNNSDLKNETFATAESFFPNSPSVKFAFLKDIGHFVHLESTDEVISSLRNLLAVPLRKR